MRLPGRAVPCTPTLQIVLEKRDKEQSLEIPGEMLPAMKETWTPKNHRLCRSLSGDGGTSVFTSRLAGSICDELSAEEGYGFLREGGEPAKLLERVKGMAWRTEQTEQRRMTTKFQHTPGWGEDKKSANRKKIR